MPQKTVFLRTACFMALVACLLFANTRCIEQCQEHGLQRQERALIAANYTSKLNDTIDTVATPITSEASAPTSSSAASPTLKSAPPPATPATAPPPIVPATPLEPSPTPTGSPTAVNAPLAGTPTAPVAPPVAVPSSVPTLISSPSTAIPVSNTNAPISPPFSKSSGPLVVPILDCIVVRGSEYNAYFSYENKGSSEVQVPIGKGNKFSSPSEPTTFGAGRSAFFPASVFVATLSQSTSWQLSSYLLEVDPQDISLHCKEDVGFVVTLSTAYPPNSSFVDSFIRVIADQFNVSLPSVNVTVTQQGTNYEVHVTISATTDQLAEVIKRAKEVISDPDVIERPLKQLLPSDTELVSVRGEPSPKEKKGVFEDSSTSSKSSKILLSFWLLSFVILFLYL